MVSIKCREMRCASPKAGLKQAWIEVQVKEGRRILGRYDTLEQARTEFPEAIVPTDFCRNYASILKNL